MLISAGAPLDTADGDGDTALMHASTSGQAATLDLLLQGKADPNVANAAGTTALMRAAETGQEGMVESLLKAGAAPDATADGVSALMLASGAGHEAVAKVRSCSSFENAPGSARCELTGIIPTGWPARAPEDS